MSSFDDNGVSAAETNLPRPPPIKRVVRWHHDFTLEHRVRSEDLEADGGRLAELDRVDHRPNHARQLPGPAAERYPTQQLRVLDLDRTKPSLADEDDDCSHDEHCGHVPTSEDQQEEGMEERSTNSHADSTNLLSAAITSCIALSWADEKGLFRW